MKKHLRQIPLDTELTVGNKINKGIEVISEIWETGFRTVSKLKLLGIKLPILIRRSYVFDERAWPGKAFDQRELREYFSPFSQPYKEINLMLRGA